ncbi:MAG: four helix bundle protein [Caldilineaceae bacterium]
MVDRLKRVGSYRELLVYQKSRTLALEIFQATKEFPKAEMYSLTDQIRRSSRSIGAQIAEAWAKRRYEKHFVSKLTDADGEQQETQHWIGIAYDCQYWDEATAADLRDKCQEIGCLLGGMLEKSEQFSNSASHTINEATVEYIISIPSTYDDKYCPTA